MLYLTIMLTETQKNELQQRSLEKLLREKGIKLDEETKSAMSYWHGILVNCYLITTLHP